MKALKNCLVATSVFALVLAALMLLNPSEVQGKPENQVVVVNTGDQPVPVVVQGTTAISGAVAIAGTPTVAVASSASNPIFVTRADNPEKYPFQRAVNVIVADGSFVGDATITVPAGTHWVIEQVCLDSAMPVGQSIRASVMTVESGAQIAHTMLTVPRGTFNFGSGDFDTFEATHSTRIYANGDVGLHIARNASVGQTSVYFAVSGHFVN